MHILESLEVLRHEMQMAAKGPAIKNYDLVSNDTEGSEPITDLEAFVNECIDDFRETLICGLKDMKNNTPFTEQELNDWIVEEYCRNDNPPTVLMKATAKWVIDKYIQQKL